MIVDLKKEEFCRFMSFGSSSKDRAAAVAEVLRDKEVRSVTQSVGWSVLE